MSSLKINQSSVNEQPDNNNLKKGVLYFDGGTYPLNPGHGGAGAVLIIDKKEYSFSKYLGKKITNNQAEYQGLLLGLTEAIALEISHLQVYGDSQLVINQVTGEYACRDEKLYPLCEKAKSLVLQFQEFSINWIKREQNDKADAAATVALQEIMGNSAKMPTNLPIHEPKEKLKKIIQRLNQQGEGARFKEWIQLKSGNDEFSRLRGEKLIEAVPVEVREAITLALSEEEQEIFESCLRWWLRGLKANLAVKKSRVNLEISKNCYQK